MEQYQVPSTVAGALELAAEHYRQLARVDAYRKDPVLWYAERKGGWFWSKQREVCHSVVENKFTAVKSGNGVGKTRLAAELAQWWIDTHLDVLDETMVITTGPVFSQITGVLWEYIRKGHRDTGFVGTINERATWHSDDRYRIGEGIKPADGNEAAIMGRHYKYTLVIIDEAGGISREMFRAIHAITTTPTCRVLGIGNPFDPNMYFGDIFQGNNGQGMSTWNKITISVLDTPNFTGEECPEYIKEQLPDESWIQQKREEIGEGSNEWLATVLGEFPIETEDALFPLNQLFEATERELFPDEEDPVWLGVDVNRGGTDFSAVVKHCGGRVEILDVWHSDDALEAANRVHEHAVRHGATQVRIDSIGPGSGVIDMLVPQSVNYDYRVIAMNGSWSSPDPTKWLNARAWWHDTVRKMLRAGTISLPEPVQGAPSSKLFDEMRHLRYRYSNGGVGGLQIESKAEMRRRGIKSPDISDAVMYACAQLQMDDPLAEFAPGDEFSMAPEDMFDYEGDFAISPV